MTRPHDIVRKHDNFNIDGEEENEDLKDECTGAGTSLTDRVTPGKSSSHDNDGSDTASRASLNDLEPLPYVKQLCPRDTSSSSPETGILEEERLAWADLGRSDSPQQGRIGTALRENSLDTGVLRRPTSSRDNEECSKTIKIELDDLLDINCDGGIWDRNDEHVRMPSPDTMMPTVPGWSFDPILSRSDDSGDSSTVLDTTELDAPELDDLFTAAETDVIATGGVDEWAEFGNAPRLHAGNEWCEDLNVMPTSVKILPSENVVDALSQEVSVSTIASRRKTRTPTPNCSKGSFDVCICTVYRLLTLWVRQHYQCSNTLLNPPR